NGGGLCKLGRAGPMSKVQRQIVAGIGVLMLLVRAASGQEASAVGVIKPPTFAEVRAIFAARCLACHGNDPKDLKGDYDLRSREAAIKGGESGDTAIVPGDPEQSPLYKAITWADDALQM